MTQGIYEIEATERLDIENKPMDMICVKGQYGSNYYHKEGRDFHRTELEAINQALEMGSKKIKTIHKQINTMECKQAQLRNRREELVKNA